MLKEKTLSPENEDEGRIKEALEKIDFDRLQKELGDVFGIQGEYADPSRSKEDVRELIEALGVLTIELKEKAKEYDAILSDEASARNISLVVTKVLNKQLETEGENKIPVYFVASGRSLEPDFLGTNNFLDEHENEFKKVLVVTEFVQKGKAINNFVKALEEHGVDYDIAVLSADKRFEHNEDYAKLREKMIIGAEDSSFGAILPVSGKDVYSGVSKKDLSLYKGGEPHPAKLPKERSGKVRGARRDVNLIAEELYKLLDTEEQTQ